jgi:hypothetical protein
LRIKIRFDSKNNYKKHKPNKKKYLIKLTLKIYKTLCMNLIKEWAVASVQSCVAIEQQIKINDYQTQIKIIIC